MSLLEHLHERFVHDRRSRILSEHLANVIPRGCRMLDVGSGDGLLGNLVSQLRPDLAISGIDVLLRPRTLIPTNKFDGQTLPYVNGSFDGVIFVDVLHHTTDPMVLLREAKRVARSTIVIKDHLVEALFARQTLRFMDRTGNARYGISLPYNYWSKNKWFGTFDDLGLKIGTWTTNLGLYPRPASWIFDRSLHFVTRLDIL